MSTDNTPRASYPTKALKEVAARVAVTDYDVGDIVIANEGSGRERTPMARQIKTREEADDLIKLACAREIGLGRDLVIRTNDQLDADFLMGWLSTSRGRYSMQREQEPNSRMFGGRIVRWDDLAQLQVPVPPRDVQAEQKRLLSLSVGWLDDHIANMEKLVGTLHKLRDAYAVEITQKGADKTEVGGWMRTLVVGHPFLSGKRSGDEAEREPVGKTQDQPAVVAGTPTAAVGKPKGP